MIGGQRIQVGRAHVGKIADIAIVADTYHITVETGVTLPAAGPPARTSSS